MDKMRLTEELVQKMHVSYTEAKDALEATGWSTLDAAVYIENNKKSARRSKFKEITGNAANTLKKAWDYCNARDLEIFRNNSRAAVLPLPAAIVLTAVLFEIALPAAVIAMLFGVSFRISDEKASLGYNAACGFTIGSDSVNLNK